MQVPLLPGPTEGSWEGHWACRGLSLPIYKMGAWSKPFYFEESVVGLSGLSFSIHMPAGGDVCQIGLKQDRV